MDNEKLYNLYYDELSSMSSNLRFWYVMQEHDEWQIAKKHNDDDEDKQLAIR